MFTSLKNIHRLSRFSIIVAIDNNYGIAKANTIPWKNKSDMNFFKQITYNSTVIMGRNTFESLKKPLANRNNIVISRQNISDIITFPSIFHALNFCEYSKNLKADNYDKVFIIGGEKIYEEALDKYNYLCDKIYVSHIDGNYDCDRFFPYHKINKQKVKEELIEGTYDSFKLEKITIGLQHDEEQYLKILKNIRDNGDYRLDRTNVGTLSLSGQQMVYNLTNSFPLLTTKKTWFKGIVEELLFFIRGKCDANELETLGINFWKANTSKQYMEAYNLPWKEGDMGPLYPHSWRHYGAPYEGCDKEYLGIDQLGELIEGIKNNPYSRRHIVCSWNPCEINNMVLPPCHCMFQFYVGNKDNSPYYLDCILTQRSGDMFLGIPFNIASYALLTYIIGNITGLQPRKLVHNISDAHIYMNHLDAVNQQLNRTPFPFPQLRIKRQLSSIDDNLTFDDFELIDYNSWGLIKAEMAI